MPTSRILFITGTDTGVGKTLLTALLLQSLRAHGCHALAIKPFCSGTRADVTLLRAVQERELTVEEINPHYFPEPVAPLVAARMHHPTIRLEQVVEHINNLAPRCQHLLIEGVGGLLVPLGEDFSVLDLIACLHCDVIVLSTNKLGTINHTLLTVRALLAIACDRPRITQHATRSTENSRSSFTKVVLMNRRTQDPSAASNPKILTELLAPIPLIPFPFLGQPCRSLEAIKGTQKKLQKTLARILR